MSKKLGIVVAGAVAAVGLLAATPLAFADDANGAHIQIGGGSQDNTVQRPLQVCNNSLFEGVVGDHAKKQSNSDSHDGKCAQKNSAEDNSGSN